MQHTGPAESHASVLLTTPDHPGKRAWHGETMTCRFAAGFRHRREMVIRPEYPMQAQGLLVPKMWPDFGP